MSGRWPANVILSPGMAEVLNEQSGILKSGAYKPHHRQAAPKGTGVTHGNMDTVPGTPREASEGGASRFFLTAGYEPWELEWIYQVGLRPCRVGAR